MLAIVLSQMIFNQKSFDDAWEPFSLFVSSNEPCFGEEIGVETLMNIVKDEKCTIGKLNCWIGLGCDFLIFLL
jgi:hypothetical protein